MQITVPTICNKAQVAIHRKKIVPHSECSESIELFHKATLVVELYSS